MLIAHLPAGYILTRASHSKGAVMGLVLLASVLPDFDMLWFHLVDNGQVLHHKYWPHIPAFWGMIALIILPLIAMQKRQWLLPAILFFVAIFLHLIMDTVVGDIMWLWPLSDQFFRFATVPATQSNWVLSFMFHWSFLLELLICAIAITLFFRKRNR